MSRVRLDMMNTRFGPAKWSILLGYLLPLIYWILYLTKGAPTFTSHDWLKEQVFSNVLREALVNGTVPWRLTEAFYHPVADFIANPEISLTPDFILLGVLPNNVYFVAHALIFMTLGFVGLAMLARRYGLSSLTFVFFSVIFFCNGYVSAHLSEGHVQWLACFLLPYFFYWLGDLGENSPIIQKAGALKLGLLFGFMFLNGSFHVAIWSLMFMFLAAVYRPDLWRWVAWTAMVALLLWVCRLVPGALYYANAAGTDFVSGYPSFSTLLDALVYTYNPDRPPLGGSFGQLKWHEYSLFVGFVGFFFMVVGVWAYLRKCAHTVPVWWIPAAMAMLLLSLGDLYQLIPNSGLPFATIERAASRFVVMPFFVALLVGAVGFSKLEQSLGRSIRLSLLLVFIPMLGEFFQNARKWRIQSYEQVMGVNDIPVIRIAETYNQSIKGVVTASWLISALVALTVIILLRKLDKSA